jgi:hypothetical protein
LEFVIFNKTLISPWGEAGLSGMWRAVTQVLIPEIRQDSPQVNYYNNNIRNLTWIFPSRADLNGA